MTTFELPLFPLKTVLFPGMPLKLYIFEDRYKAMINRCAETDHNFGVVLIREGHEALGPLAEPHPIGCTAHIVQIERLENDRMNIIAVGLERFHIRELHYDEPYLTGEVETLPIFHQDNQVLDQAGERLRPWVQRYLTVLAQMSEEMSFDPARLPDDPLALGYLAASLVQIPPDQKQPLLAANQAAELLTNVRTIYRREVAILNALLARETREQKHFFSLN